MAQAITELANFMKLGLEALARKVADQEIVILGICRNVEFDLESDIRSLLAAFSDFHQVHFRIVESDSTDSTVAALTYLKSVIPNFEFVTLGSLDSQIPSRVERIAYCRNKCLDLLAEDDLLRDCNFVAVSDLDGVNKLLNRASVLSCWIRDDWDVCTANQLGPYYDIYALRHPEWSPNDCWWYEAQLRQGGLNSISARERAVYSRQRTIYRNSPWIEVDSAFGGLAIYKRPSLRRVRYSSLDFSGREICEHVVIHNQMRADGSKILINPRFINHGWSEHSQPNKMWNRIKRLIRKTFILSRIYR